MNYRHAFHAGNFADIVKHAALTVLLDRLTLGRGGLTVIDTHAGAGVYDLAGPEATKAAESRAGVARLLEEPTPPEPFEVLIAAVRRINPDGVLRFYPGSPMLIAAGLRPGDSFIACELRSDDHAALGELLAGRAEVLKEDGFALALRRAPREGPALIHIDPPFEKGDDYARAAEAAAAAAQNADAVVMVWLPLKDLETFDGFLRRLEGLTAAPMAVAECRLRPLDDPTRMNGCALVTLNPPAGFAPVLEEICRWTAQRAGEGAGLARVMEI